MELEARAGGVRQCRDATCLFPEADRAALAAALPVTSGEERAPRPDCFLTYQIEYVVACTKLFDSSLPKHVFIH